MLRRHPQDPDVAEVSVHGSVHDSSGPQRYQFVPSVRSGRHRTVRNVLTCDNGQSGRCPTTANGIVCRTIYRTGSGWLPSGMAD